MREPSLLRVLACPACVRRSPPPGGAAQGELEVEGDAAPPKVLRCKQCGRRFQIEDGIPDLVLSADTGPSLAGPT